MKFEPCEIPDVIVIEPRVFADERGHFCEVFHEQRFAEAGIAAHFVQDNHSRSKRGVLRGLHYQIEQAQGKLVRVVDGCVFDVAVDLRRSSRTFGRWVGVMLSAENRRMMYIPPGFAHGFCVVSDGADICYKCTDLYAPQHERTLLWNDPDLDITWPLDGTAPLLSDKDAIGCRFVDAECYP